MQKTVLYGIIAAVVVAAGAGIAFAAMSMNTAEPAVASPQSSDDNQVRVIKHDMGETEITGTPERVVLLDTPSFSIMMELGIEPVGVQSWEEDALAEGKIFWEAYYPGITQIWPNAVNTGSSEPNLEVITQLSQT